MTPTLITHDATLDNLSATDYRDMVIELRQSMSLDKMIAALQSEFSKPLWADVEKGVKVANRKQRNELRRLFNMPPLPPTVADAVSVASPDAAVWMVGEGTPETVVMLANSEPVTIHVNGSVSVIDTMPAMPSRNAQDAQKRRIRYARPCATETQDAERIANGATWGEVIDAGNDVLRKMRAYE